MRVLDLRLGVDVGGTNTDAVVLDRADHVLAKAKVSTTASPAAGIHNAIGAVLASPGVDVARVTHLMVGTTQVANAVLERRGLLKVGVIRIGGPATRAVRPLYGWPQDLRSAISVAEIIVDGGIEFDGRDITQLDVEAIARFCSQIAGQADGIAITSVFAPVSARHELVAEQVVRRALGDINITLSHRIGSVGLLERENATVLNATLLGVARHVIQATEQSSGAHGLADPVTFFAQNDGTLMSLDYALQYPVFTIGNGPANSVSGAAFLSGTTDAIVVDVGGTSTDVGILTSGFPRQSSHGVRIGGIKTNFRMPDLVTIALGGGSVVTRDGAGSVRIGPRSVGYLLQDEAVSFRGPTLTLTDAAVAAERMQLGEREALYPHADLLALAIRASDEMITEAVDRIKTSEAAVPVVAVGGGSPLVPNSIPGVTEVIRPQHSDVANAIGAAIASVSGEVDRIFHLGADGRARALADASEDARRSAVAAGADPETVEIVEIEEVPLSYLTLPAVRIRARATGTLEGA